MSARQRRENETYEEYRDNLKHEGIMEKRKRPRTYLAKHKVSYSAEGGYTINPTQYRKPESLS